MTFKKGHTTRLGQKNPYAGRKKSLPATVKEIMDNDWHNLGDYLTKLGELAKNGDKEALIYLINRHMGTPKQSIESKTINIELDADTLFMATRDQVEAYKIKLLTEPNGGHHTPTDSDKKEE